MKKILITGSTGFIGSSLFLNLKGKYKIYLVLRKKNKKKPNLGKNHKIIYFKNYEHLNMQLKKINADILLHCATHYVKKHNFTDISKIIKANILFGNIILENLCSMKVKKFINFSTVWENYNGKNGLSFNLYSAYKQSFRKIIDYYKIKNKNIKFYNIFISDTYGENDKRKKLISSLRHSYFNNKIQIIISKKLYVNLLNVKDILSAINLIVAKKIIPGNYILKNTIDFNLFNIVSKINKKKNKTLKVKWMSSKIIKEKIYKYKMLSYWKPKFSSLDHLVNFIIKN